MTYDIKITNGLVIDPYNKTKEIKDLYIKDRFIIDNVNENDTAKQVIDANGCLVMPGLIEGHSHVFYGATSACIPADVIMLPGGVTTTIDCGTSGYANFDVFYRTTIANSVSNIRVFLNLIPAGLTNEVGSEDPNPKYFNAEKIIDCVNRYPHIIKGLKLRISKDLCKGNGLEILQKAIEVANKVKLPLALHVMDPPIDIAEIAKLLRPGDIWVHIFQQKGQTIVDENGKINAALFEAKKRGVLFDPSGGRSAFSIDYLKKALEQNFVPELLSTDQVSLNVYEPPLHSLLYTMSFYLNLGYNFDDVLNMVTVNIAKVLGEEKELCSLDGGTVADICIVKNKEVEKTFFDKYGDSFVGKQLLVPQMTIKDGKVVYRNIEF